MAKDSSFDVVSTVDMQEVDNAVQQTARELTQRYDLKGSGSSIELSKPDATITVAAPAEFVSKQVIDILNGRLVKRGVDLKSRFRVRRLRARRRPCGPGHRQGVRQEDLQGHP